MADRLPDILVHEISPDWFATNWPHQTSQTSGETRSEVISNYVVLYNTQHGTDKTEADFRWIGPIWLTVYLSRNGEDWVATSYADKMYQITRSTEEQVKSDFITHFMTEYEEWPSEIVATDENVDWLYDI